MTLRSLWRRILGLGPIFVGHRTGCACAPADLAVDGRADQRGRWNRHPVRPHAHDSPTQRILAVFDWLFRWFGEPDYRGCSFINSFGDLGVTSQAVADIAKAHKDAFRRYLADLVTAADAPAWLTDQLVPLAEGAMTTAAISGSPEPARHAKDAARTLLRAAHADVATAA